MPETPLTIDLSGPQRHVVLAVEPPANPFPKRVDFDVALPGGAPGQLARVSTQVVFTTGVRAGRRGT
jgi:hypothetical protein